MTIHILTNISRSKDSQAMKFDQSIEHKMRNIFYTQNVGKKLVPDPILKVEIEDIFGSKVSSDPDHLFLPYVKLF